MDEKIDGRTKEARAMKEADAPEERRVSRETRKPFGSQVQKLAFPPREGFHRHWFNDVPGRLTSAKDAGYTHVIDHVTQKPVTRVVGVTQQGAPMDGYLMEIPKEWWEADMAANEQLVKEKEDTIRRGQVEAADPRERDSHFTNTAQGRRIDIRNSMARR